MSIEKIEEFAESGEKHLNNLDVKQGFQQAEKPERQWFNYLLNDFSKKINQVIDGLSDIDFEFDGFAPKISELESNYTEISSELTRVSDDFKSADAVLQGQIDSIGGGKFAYTTYTKMEAAAALPDEDPLKLPANSSIDVTNDTDPLKNGTYSYDGAVFAKSIYDVETIVRTKVLNTFKTKALMDASALPDGADAQVTDDTVNNGLYVKTAGAWVKSDYDPLTQAKVYTDTKIEIDDSDTDNIINEIDANGTSVRRVDKDGKHWFYGIEDDLKTALDKSDTNTLIALEESEAIAEIRDSNNVLTFKQTLDGDIHAVGTGNISQAIRDFKSGSNSTDSTLEAKYLAGKYADYTLAETLTSYKDVGSLLTAVQVDSLGLFTHPVGVIRIPTITRIGKTKYLLFYEARESYDDYGIISQGVATLNIDPATLEPTLTNHQSLGDGYIDGATDKLWTFMYGCGLKLASGRIICMYVERQKNLEHFLMTRYSDDDGVTWSEPEDISYVKGDFTNGMLPCSQGLEKRFGQHVGRIIFPVWTSGVYYTVADFRATYIYSDDGGLTWLRGEEAPYGTGNEVQIAEDLNGDMLFAIRLQNKTPAKIIARHSDKTKEYRTVEVNKSLTDEKIMSGLIQGDNRWDFSATKFILSTCLTESRTTLLIHTSYDGGVNWRTHTLPEALNQAVGYTCIESISASHKLIIWEADNLTNLDYTIISLNTLIAGA